MPGIRSDADQQWLLDSMQGESESYWIGLKAGDSTEFNGRWTAKEMPDEDLAGEWVY